MKVIANLHEPNDAHLGVSKGKPSGRGWGGKQGLKLYHRLRTSEAVKSGKVSDLSDIELLIPGIGSDKISDLAINVLRGEFVAYTEEQCKLLGIQTEMVNSGLYWNFEQKAWESRYAELPVYQSQRILLIPKMAVRMRLIPNYEEFYSKFVLNYLAAEHLSANDSLVTLLQNGTTKVYKKDLKNKYKISKEFLYEFTIRHPEILRDYKTAIRGKGKPISDEQIESRQPDPREIVVSDLERLRQIPAGSEAANDFHDFILGALTEIFYPRLTNPTKEQKANEGRKRIDVVFNNSAESGFFSSLVNRHKFHCPYILIECKNYAEDPENPELDQLQGRFSRKRGNVGFLICRKVTDPEKMLKRLRDIVQHTEGLVIVLDDSDITDLLEIKTSGIANEIDDYLDAKLKPILF